MSYRCNAASSSRSLRVSAVMRVEKFFESLVPPSGRPAPPGPAVSFALHNHHLIYVMMNAWFHMAICMSRREDASRSNDFSYENGA